jgi:hypothetical protein
VVQQHERKQARDLLVVDLGRQLASEPDRFGGEVDVAGVALVEDQVEHAQHRGDITGPVEPHARDGPLGASVRRAASNPPATKPHVATASTVSLDCDLCAEQH